MLGMVDLRARLLRSRHVRGPAREDQQPCRAPSPCPQSASPSHRPWRYAPALAAAIPPGTHAEPVLELADGLHGRARIVVAVADRRSSPARLEIWDFSQNNDKGAPRPPIGPPQVLLDARGLPRRRWLGPRRRGRPSAARSPDPATRPSARSASSANRRRCLPELARLAAASTQGDAPTRAHALADFTRGLDERLLLERLPELLRRLQSPAWTIDPPRRSRPPPRKDLRPRRRAQPSSSS
jgi:hypothetical protein